jgi:hypothetical protein
MRCLAGLGLLMLALAGCDEPSGGCTGEENACGTDDAGNLAVINCEYLSCGSAFACGSDVITRTCPAGDTCFEHTDLTGPRGPSDPVQTSAPIFACSSWLPDGG